MTETTHAKIPQHLRRYIVEQNYDRYTPEDQAVWRYILRQLKHFLSRHAHESYISGLQKTGITIDRIPRIEDIDSKLVEFGWGAVPVSGFIPPAAFMEFQSIGVLPIASDMRSLDHLLYTPAPDIVHEAAGHAPILVHPEYAVYLRQYGEVARHSIISKEDMDQYEAIRVLSDVKEDPRSTKNEIGLAEKRLQEMNSQLTFVSEAALLSRMNWWTAEYGLIGDLANPRIFGAGLLSSVGEAKQCLQSDVVKIPLSVDCVNFSYDITEKQPQLFVARDFGHLSVVLEQLAAQLSFKRGGIWGLERAREARTVNTVQLNSGLQISGVLKNFIVANGSEEPIYLQVDGPTQLSVQYQQLSGHGTQRHPHGFSSPIGFLVNQRRCLSQFRESELAGIGLSRNQRARLKFESGVVVEGLVKDWLYHDEQLILVTWTDCRVALHDQVLFDPNWGEFDMAVGSEVKSVFGGPADRSHYGSTDEFVAKRVPPREFDSIAKERNSLYQDVRDLRESGTSPSAQGRWEKLSQKFLSSANAPWLIGVQLVDLGYLLGLSDEVQAPLKARLTEMGQTSSDVQACIADGLKLAGQQL